MDDLGEIIRKNYKIIIPLVIIVFVILGILIVKSFYTVIPETGRANIERIKQQKFESIKELLEYYECEYVGLEKSYEDEYIIKLSAKLRLLPYEGYVSNEDFYMSLLNDIAYYYNYQNFILIDNENELKIKITCENAEIKKIIVNGIEDYFNEKRKEMALREYKEIKETSLNISNNLINELITNNWKKDIVFGSKESTFNGYDVYFDEGIEVRKLQDKIYNVVFTEKYSNEIIDGITTKSTRNEVVLKLGEPTFSDNESGVIGYKGKDLYIFFYDNCISIYRREKNDVTEVLNLLTEFKKENIDILELMNQITYIWPDYNEYDYNASSLFISYPLKGFEIKVNYENERGIVFYNNFNTSESTIKNYLDSEDFKAYLQEDYVFKTEKKRVLNLDKFVIENQTEDYYESNLYDLAFDRTEDGSIVKTYFISKDKNRVNRELNDSFNSYAWISDTYFVFGKQGKGLYYMDLNTGIVNTLTDGTENYNITKSDLGVIVYDNKEQRFEF